MKPKAENVKDEKRGSQVIGDNQVESNLEDDSEISEDCSNLSVEDKVVQLEADLELAKNQVAEYYAHLQRLQADFDNYRKRTQKEKEDISKYAAERLVGAILPVLDNFERAIGSVQTSPDLAGYAQGVEMIFRQMHNVLIKEGLAAIEAVGQPFDPNLHEAILSVESEEHPENTVVEEVQKGYYLKDRVLRPSMVKVSS